MAGIKLYQASDRDPRKSPFTVALELQDRLKELADNPKTEPKDVAACARAWDVLEDRKRILRNKPLPGAYKPKEKRQRSIDIASEPMALPEPTIIDQPVVPKE